MLLGNALRGMARRSAARGRGTRPGPGHGRRATPLALEDLEERCLLSYVFTLIADDAGGSVVFNRPALNNDGTVAFRARDGAGVACIYSNPDGKLIPIVCSAPGDNIMGDHPINSAGAVPYRMVYGAGGQDLFTSSGGKPTLIACTYDSPGCLSGDLSDLLGTPRINDAGAVAFTADWAKGVRAVMVGDGETLRRLYDTEQHFYDVVSTSGLNNSGRVHIIANPVEGVTGIYTGDGEDLTTIADTSDAFSDVRSASMNDAGVMAFRGTLRAGGQLILLGDGGSLTIYALAGGTYVNFGTAVGGLALNNAGTVAFEATLSDGRVGIFTGPDPAADKVLAIGDELFGSPVTVLENGFINSSLNDAGQLAFRATLADGRVVIVRADPARAPGGHHFAPGPDVVPALATASGVLHRFLAAPELPSAAPALQFIVVSQLRQDTAPRSESSVSTDLASPRAVERVFSDLARSGVADFARGNPALVAPWAE